MSDRFFWQQLGLEPGASRREIKRAYYLLARRNHPDIFPEDRKAVQELKMIALNEAYAYLMSQARLDGGFPGSEGLSSKETGRTRADSERCTEDAEQANGSGGRQRTAEPAAGPQNQAGATGVADTPGNGTDLGFHKDPSYAYYKQGFVHFSRAIQGVEALYRSLSQRRVVHFKPRDDAYQRFADGLVELRRAHEYFSRVVQDFTVSIWKHDASLKLSRIERFSTLYRRILGNLTSSG